MPMEQVEIEKLIKASLPDAQIEIIDLAGDNNHFSAHVISAAFEGKSRIQQHKMVYDALGDKMGGILHALALKTSIKKD
ncbi:BolA family transcriptional regulator [Pelagibacterales bacterium]|jgi:stress-induced morphogen|nr:BolA family transcriptional regulator [Pelagibacterales bacterium]MDA9137257.1 BolA family transcriptional regulator [Pelagibacterales bacterium]MDA9373266.1 BolA family transcriptional regulator [Pelagibacterales bacterium]MDA9980374.1 BolA family transcriptional regulator [Pelagibacterales bacterium]MDB4220340.1 BolA family transcriptional regulator [Pelagibacterales bacterium]|tara:strand:+ start:200 stop:436 length:237 start_codon:yes stop_codon:yes gene_type:complete